jgi:diguanylate cyclase (GGDEF)-like protein
MGILTSRSNRFLAAIASLAFAAMLLIGLTYAITESSRRALAADTGVATDLGTLATQLSDATHEQEAAVDDYMLTRSPDASARLTDAIAGESRIAATIDALAGGQPDLTLAVAHVSAASAAWRVAFVDPAVRAVNSGQSLAAIVEDAGTDTVGIRESLADLDSALVREDQALSDRDDALAAARTVATAVALAGMLVATLLGLWVVRRYGKTLDRDALRAGVLNRFTEVTSFALDSTAVAVSNLEALGLLVHPDAAVTHVLNRSKDRAIPEATLGEAIAEILPLNALGRCAGIVRGSMFVTSDASAPLSVHCPVYPMTSGTVACVPLNSIEHVGAVHLYWKQTDALPLEIRASVVRIAEHAALSIANQRLLVALQAQASTDARTSLANSRAFDVALEEALAGRTADESIAVLMLDLDHFKDFNDRHGHPGGDEALRAFAEVLRSCMRDGDMAARYGGEEFVVLLRGVESSGALAVAHRILSRTESTIISLGPGITDRLTVSIGVAVAPAQGIERLTILRVADQALYAAKAAGRNRVVYGGEPDHDLHALALPAVGA